ncbi:MAG: protein phosphatase 2C domain-containing protein [Candidatus Aenigmatarchaeota archaeon]
MSETREEIIKETVFSLNETASALTRQQDAVFDGQNLRIGFLEKDEKGDDLAEDKRKEQAEKLAQRLNALKDAQGKEILGRQITAEEILTLPDEIKKLISKGELNGILVNILGSSPQNSEASALGMVVFLDYIKTNPDKLHSELLQEGYQRVIEILNKAYPQNPQNLSFVFSLIDKEGTLSAIVLGDQQITAFNEQGQKKGEEIKEEKEADGSPKIQTLRLEKGDKVFVCHKDKASEIDGKKGVKETIESLTKEKSDPSSSGAGGEGEEKQEPITIPQAYDPYETLRRLAEKHIPPYYEDTEIGISYEEFIKKHPIEYQQAQQLIEEAKGKIPRKQEESDFDYQKRVIEEVEKRLRYSGDYLGDLTDDIYQLIRGKKYEREYLVLMGVEAEKIRLFREENKRRLAEYSLPNFRRAVKTEVSHTDTPVYIEGDFDNIFVEKGGRREIQEMAKRDLYAFTLIADRLLDVTVTSEKDSETYRQKMRKLKQKIEDESLSQQERDKASKELVDLRRRFYQIVIESMRYIDHQNRYQDNEPQARMIKVLKEIRKKQNIEELINQYEGVMINLSERHKREMKELLDRDPQHLLDYALKGADLMDRRISYAPSLLDIPDKIYYKKFVQKLEDKDKLPIPQQLDSTLTTGRTPQMGIGEIPTGEGGKEGELETASSGGELPEERRKQYIGGKSPEEYKETPPQAPVISSSESGPSTIVELPKVLTAAFVEEEIAYENAQDVKRHLTSLEEELFRDKLLFKKFRVIDGLSDALARLSGKLAQKGFVGKIASIVPGVLSGIIKGFRHPFHYVWQGTLFKPSFDRQRHQFSAEMIGMIRQGLVGDTSVPLDVRVEIIELALRKGLKERNKGLFGRFRWFLYDTFVYNFAGLFGAKSSEQILAQRWLNDQIEKVKKGEATESDFNKEWQLMRQLYLQQQDKEAQRFAQRREGMSLQDVDRLGQGIRTLAGERRVLLAEVNPQLNERAQQKIKEIIAKYASQLKGETNEERREEIKRQLLIEVNQYLRSDEFYGQLTEEQRKLFSPKEIASNLVSLTEQVSQYWDENGYLRQTEEGKTLWQEVRVDIVLGKGAWGGRRGQTRYEGLEGIGGWREKLERRIVDRAIGLSAPGIETAVKRTNLWLGILGGAGLTAKEVGLYTLAGTIGYYGSGIITSLLGKGATKLAGTAGALAFVAGTGGVGIIPILGAGAGVGALAAIKEGSRLKEERFQLSREMAWERQDVAGALIRAEMKESLVQPKRAREITASIRNLLSKENLTFQEVNQLILLLAETTARLDLTELSQQEGGLQHFISYTEGKDKEEFTELTGAVLDAKIRLWNLLKDNQDLRERIFPGEDISTVEKFSLVFGKLSALAEAQLRFGSGEKYIKEIEKLLKKEKDRFGFANDQEVEAFIKRITEPMIDLKITQEESLRQKNKNFRQIRARRQTMVFATSVASSLISYYTISPISGAISGAIKEEVQELKNEGFSQWSREWVDVIRDGKFQLELDSSGRLVTDLTSLQRVALRIHNYFEPPLGPTHTVSIDGVRIELPAVYDWQQTTIDGQRYDALVDLRTGEVIVDMSGYRIDDPSGFQAFIKDLETHGITIKSIEIPGPVQPVEFLKPTTTFQIENPVTHKPMTVPAGEGWHCQWRQDGDKYDLVVIDEKTGSIMHFPDGREVILIDDAQLTTEGKIIGGVYDARIIHIELRPEAVEILEGKEAELAWSEIVSKLPSQRWWRYFQQYQFYNYVYRNPDGSYGIILDASKMGVTVNPLTGQLENVQDIISDPSRAPYGVQFTIHIPGLGAIRIDDVSDGIVDGKLKLNPLDNSHMVTSCGQPVMFHGQEMTMQQLAQIIDQERLGAHIKEAGLEVGSTPVSLATEYRGWLDVFNIARGRYGFITAGFTDADGVYNHLAAIRGSGELAIGVRVEEGFNVSMSGPLMSEIQSISTMYRIIAAPVSYELPFEKVYLPPIVVRETMEKSVRADTTVPSSTSQTPPTSQPSAGETQTFKQPQRVFTFGPEQKKALLDLSQQEEQRLNGIIGLTDETKKEEEIARIAREIGKSEEEVKQALADENERKKLALDLALRKMAEESLTDEEKNKEEKEKIIKQRMEELRRILTSAEASLDILPSLDLEEEDYQKEKKAVIEFLKEESLDNINQQLQVLGLPPLTQEEFDELKTNDKKAEELAKQIIISSKKKELESQIIRKIFQEEVQRLEGEDEQAYKKYLQAYSLILSLTQQLVSTTDDAQRQQLEQRLIEAKTGFNNLLQDQKVQTVLKTLQGKVNKRYEEEYKQRVEEEVRKLEEKIQKWEEASSRIEIRETPNITMSGHSEKGARTNDEDAYFDGDFHFGISFTDEDLKKFGVLGNNESLLDLKTKLTKNGLSVAIVADGMGGHGNGEVASAIAIVGFVKELVKSFDQKKMLSEDILREIVVKVNEYILNYNSNFNKDSGSTLVAQITDNEGNTWIISVGDSRIYQIDSQNNCLLLTPDQSLVWRLMEIGGDNGINNPWEILIHSLKAYLLQVLGGGKKKKLSADSIFVSNLGKLSTGTRLVLTCDGVWEGINIKTLIGDKSKFNTRFIEIKESLRKEKLTEGVQISDEMERKIEEQAFLLAVKEFIDDFPFYEEFKNDVEYFKNNEGLDLTQARRKAALKFFGRVFWYINLGGRIENLNPQYLTREEVGNLSKDNVTAVIVNFN